MPPLPLPADHRAAAGAHALPSNVLRLAPPDTSGARLATRIEIVQAILTLAERVEVLHDSYACLRRDALLSGPELARVRTLALAMLCQLARDVAPLAQQRLEHCLFPEDTATPSGPGSLPMPLLDRAVAASATAAIEAGAGRARCRDDVDTDPVPLDFHDTLPTAYALGQRQGR